MIVEIERFEYVSTHAKNATAPVGPKTAIIRGKTAVKTAAKKRLTATARLIPTSASHQNDSSIEALRE